MSMQPEIRKPSPDISCGSWLPTAPVENLRRRAQILAQVRSFLSARGYWEVETPILSHDVSVDAHIEPFTLRMCDNGPDDAAMTGETRYLQTSPEFAMKRLLAAGSGSIFQITRAFRNGESGPIHNPEFTIVEWYRVGGRYVDLMTEVGEFAARILSRPAPEQITYRDAFLRHADLDPFQVKIDRLAELARDHGFSHDSADLDELLNFVLAAVVEPKLGFQKPVVVYDYPVSQAALAQVRHDSPAVAERFELYVDGIELCNGFQELTDADELRRRNHRANAARQRLGKANLPAESYLLGAMESGLPVCTGVALGFDRLVMLSLGARRLCEVLAFPDPVS